MIKIFFTSLLLFLFSLQVIGQDAPKIDKFYYNLPVDSCIGYIAAQIVETNYFKVQVSEQNAFSVKQGYFSESLQLDSVLLKLDCFSVAIGGSPNQISPIVYEQWLTNSFYFKNQEMANEFFLKQKSDLESLAYSSNLNVQKRNEIEFVFMLEPNANYVSHRQIHLTFEKDSGVVSMAYRLIYTQNNCNCK